MTQQSKWDEEYKSNRLVTGSNEPQNDFKRFVKYLRKKCEVEIDGLRVLDLGSGTGKNSIYLAENGAIATGIEFSQTAINIAKERSKENSLNTNFIQKSFGESFPFKDNSFDLTLDIMSSNSLTEGEREVYLREVHRVLKPGGYFFVRLLALDGDKHAETLLKTRPGNEKGTYKLPDVEITERVLSKEEFTKYYSPFFDFIKLEKKSGYMNVNGRLFKRNYWIAYLQNNKTG
jgi:ubiquinone/menaquinone biosynthesis C-methylase UbiE